MTNQLTVWASAVTKVQTLLDGDLLDMTRAGGWWTLPQPVKAGQRYQFVLDGGNPLPDPRSRYQPEGVPWAIAGVHPARTSPLGRRRPQGTSAL